VPFESLDNKQDTNPEPNDSPVAKDILKTMVIPAASSRTMKFIPGEFEVISGDDKGRIIKIGGYPTEEGSIVTIGREEVIGPRDFAHIQLKERTISRKQAELVLNNGNLYIKNLSQTNYTKLNGKEIPPNTSSELLPGSVITFGEVEMKYRL
jgi:pSer/pThr/pTyr-binding forkhead associated (FHA) protein